MNKISDINSSIIHDIRNSGVKTFLDGWIVVDYINSGSFSKVFKIVKADNVLGNQESALKVIPLDTGDVDDYRSEIKALKRIYDEKHAVKIEDYDFVSIDNDVVPTTYILLRMDLLQSLPKNLPQEEVIRLGIEICSLLSTCHKQSILHRDIKPDNILISPSGIYKLSDFGSVKFLDKSSFLTSQVS